MKTIKNIIGCLVGIFIIFGTTACDDITSKNSCIETENAQTMPVINEDEYFADGDDDLEVEYIGNIRSMIFHCRDCFFVQKMNENNKIFLKYDRDRIIELGYSPCGKCNP